MTCSPRANNPFDTPASHNLLALALKGDGLSASSVFWDVTLGSAYRREANHRETQQYVAPAGFIEQRNPFRDALRLLPNATEPTFCCESALLLGGRTGRPSFLRAPQKREDYLTKRGGTCHRTLDRAI